jgi:hypothetical protein
MINRLHDNVSEDCTPTERQWRLLDATSTSTSNLSLYLGRMGTY